MQIHGPSGSTDDLNGHENIKISSRLKTHVHNYLREREKSVSTVRETRPETGELVTTSMERGFLKAVNKGTR